MALLGRFLNRGDNSKRWQWMRKKKYFGDYNSCSGQGSIVSCKRQCLRHYVLSAPRAWLIWAVWKEEDNLSW
jgi:hypothetical protein